jgi:ABC-type spermidine/putrescine transport system permease subunit I
MSSLSNLQSQQGYNNPQQPYHNYSQTTQRPPQNLNQQGQQAGETSLAITKDPRFIAAIISFFFVLGFGYSFYHSFRSSFSILGLIMFVFHIGVTCGGIRIIFGRGKFSHYITEYQLSTPTIKPPAKKGLSELFKGCYLASAIFGGLAVIGCVVLVYGLLFGGYKIDINVKLPMLLGLLILTFFISLLVTFYCFKAFLLEYESLKQWDRIHGQNNQQGTQLQAL